MSPPVLIESSFFQLLSLACLKRQKGLDGQSAMLLKELNEQGSPAVQILCHGGINQQVVPDNDLSRQGFDGVNDEVSVHERIAVGVMT